MSFSEWVTSAFNGLTPDINGIHADAHTYTLGGWRTYQQSLVTGSGALAVAIPGLHMVAIAGDVAFLMNRMAVCSYGIGSILASQKNLGNVLEPEDFAVVLARWSGEDGVSNAALAKGCAELVGKVGGIQATSILAKSAAENAGILLGKKLAGKVGAKVGAKFGGKLGAKAAAGWIPFLGAGVSGGINLWFITQIADAAEGWYRFKLSHG